MAVIGIILSSIGLLAGAGGWFFFVGVSFLIYVSVVIVIETFIPNIYVHRLIVSLSNKIVKNKIEIIKGVEREQHNYKTFVYANAKFRT